MIQTSKHYAGARRAARRVSELVGTWRLGELLGEGAWTHVYAARPADADADRPWDFAIKLLKQDDPVAIGLMQREAQVARSVVHPNLISIFAAHAEKAPRYLVTPRLEGVAFHHVVQLGIRVPVKHALWIIRQTAEALQALHIGGWRHGDVKPENLIVAPCGHTTLIDLGFCQPVDQRPAVVPASALALTWAYAAPELFSTGYPVTGAADIYSLGVMFFEILTGERPYRSNSPEELAAEHVTAAAPSIRSMLPQLPIQVDWLIQRLLSKDPLRRPSADELIELLIGLEIDTLGDAES